MSNMDKINRDTQPDQPAKNLRFDPNNLAHGFVITGMVEMIEKDKLTPHEVFEVLEDIKRQTWSALADIHAGRG